MKRIKSFFIKAHWLVDLFFIVGVFLVLAGVFLHPKDWPAVLPRIFVDAGAAIAVACVIAHLLS